MLENTTMDSSEQSLPHLSLYYYPTCPFCVMVLNAIDDMDLDIELRHIFQNNDWREELIREGGRKTVPCLRIEQQDGSVQWMYESRGIMSYLRDQFD